MESDTDLPDLVGLNFLKMLSENLLTNHIPVIALSLSAYRNAVDAGLKAGFFSYLTKPYRLDELRDAIDAGIALWGRKFDQGGSSNSSFVAEFSPAATIVMKVRGPASGATTGINEQYLCDANR